MRVLLVCHSISSFVARDIQTLKDLGTEVEVFLWTPREILALALKLGSAVQKSSHVISWFAGDHAFLATLWARILGRKSLVILGGYEAARIPEIPYGAWCVCSRTQLSRLRRSVLWPDEAWVVEESMIGRLRRYGDITRVFEVVPTIFDPRVFRCTTSKTPQVVIVSALEYDNHAIRKGLPDFIGIARRIPEIPCIVVGLTKKFLQRFGELPSNLKVAGHLSLENLVRLLSQSKVYCNLSLHEGLCNSLCEAMLCECVPVITNIPGNLAALENDQDIEVLSANPHDVDTFVDLTKTALKLEGTPYRELIMRKYPPSMRLEAFRKFLTG